MTKTFYNDEMETLRNHILGCLNNQIAPISPAQMLQVIQALQIEIETRVKFELIQRFNKENQDATIPTTSGITNTYP